VLHVPLAGVIRPDSRGLSIEALVEFRKANYQKFYSQVKWNGRSDGIRRSQYDTVNIDQLKHWQKTFVDYKDKIKHRIEEPWIQIYTNDEHLLYNLIKVQPQCLQELHRPSSDADKLILQSKQIIVKKPTEYQFKIYLKEGYDLSTDLRSSLAQYFESLGDDVKLTKSVYHNLFTRKLWFTGGYFYAKDDKMLTFLNLMAPGFVSGIFPLVYQSQ
jgi:hypothetical protein